MRAAFEAKIAFERIRSARSLIRAAGFLRRLEAAAAQKSESAEERIDLSPFGGRSLLGNREGWRQVASPVRACTWRQHTYVSSAQ